MGSLSLSGAELVIVEQTAVEPAGHISHGRQGPHPEAEQLLEVLADHREIKPEQVFVGNGSNEGESRLPIADRYQIGTNTIDTDLITLSTHPRSQRRS